MHAPRDAHWSAVKQVLRSPPRHPRISWHTPTRTGRVALTLGVLPRDIASTLARRLFLGRLRDNPLSRALALRLSIAPWPTPSSSTPGFVSFSPSSLVQLTRLLLSSVTTFRLSTSPPTPFIIDALSTSSWISTSFESRLLSVTFEFFTCRPLSSLRISWRRACRR